MNVFCDRRTYLRVYSKPLYLINKEKYDCQLNTKDYHIIVSKYS